jgi:flavin-dependent dehydrogenase
VFPKGDVLTVGVIGARAESAALRRYYREFVARMGLAGVAPQQFSGHLTRCRSADSPLRRGRVLVAGDAAGLLEPWTREGISFAARSGAEAGRIAARAVAARPEECDRVLASYAESVLRTLGPEMAAGRAFLRAFSRNRQVFHGFLASFPGGWSLFTSLVSGDTTLAVQQRRPAVRAVVRAVGR